MCRLLIAKGADVDAREWLHSRTPLGSACFQPHMQGGRGRATTVNLSRNDFVNTLRLLIESGVDVCVSVELDNDTFWLVHALHFRKQALPMPEERKVIGGLFWLFQNYIQATTCDGVLSTDVLHPSAFATIAYSETLAALFNIWPLEGYDNHFLTCKDTLAFQSFWLLQLAEAIDGNRIYDMLSHSFCCSYAGDFHYRLPLEIDGLTTEISPMELALGSLAALGSFHHILLATGTDVNDFTKVECTMPWCHYTHQTLDAFFSLEPEEYDTLRRRVPGKSPCYGCLKYFQHYDVEDWEAVVGLVKSGRSLASVLRFASEAEREEFLVASKLCKCCRRNCYENGIRLPPRFRRGRQRMDVLR
jgi:hypothetical protein